MKENSDLQELNREIDLLLYAISHDLGAPLRAIDGFSQALAEDYGERLDKDGQDYIQRIQKAAKLLGRYIEAVLTISRETRSDMIVEDLDLARLAGEILEKYKAADPRRRVEIRIMRPLEAQGDRRLIRTLLEKLLDNAWKFTTDRDPARIEFGVVTKVEQRLFFIRDNGVGFDMRNAEKRLFGLFQRMQPENRLAGIGAGLAAARRIINRHNGRIWAESEIDSGSVFYFSI